MERSHSHLLDRLFSLEGKTALVTGGSSGIGRAIAVGLAGAGAIVGVHGTKPEGIDETRRLIADSGGSSEYLEADIAEVANCRSLVDEARGKLGRIDILINCAGMNRRKPAETFTEDDFESIVGVNQRAAFFICEAVFPIMKGQGGGKIVNIGSMTSYIGVGNVGIYGMTKAALAQLTKTLAVEWAEHNIQVNCLAPGFIKTPLTEKGLFGDSKVTDWIIKRVPQRRPGTPDEMVGLAIYLCSPASDYMTGQVIAIDGGFLAGGSWTAA
jgi:NAD(P)-dependent dehydrogenase (short-subunit alcohol dehydrogenase family)